MRELVPALIFPLMTAAIVLWEPLIAIVVVAVSICTLGGWLMIMDATGHIPRTLVPRPFQTELHTPARR